MNHKIQFFANIFANIDLKEKKNKEQKMFKINSSMKNVPIKMSLSITVTELRAGKNFKNTNSRKKNYQKINIIMLMDFFLKLRTYHVLLDWSH